MNLKIKDIRKIMEDFAPIKLKESYDNVGLMIGDTESEVTSILVALDCTLDVIDEAVEKGCNLILTHHPLLFRKPLNITNETLLGRKILKLIKNDISVYSSHTNLDSVQGGLNDLLTSLLGIQTCKTIELSPARDNEDNVSGIGRIGSFSEYVSLGELCEKIKDFLNIPFVRYTGSESRLIKKVAVINGSGQDYFGAAKSMGVDCIITGDTTYHFISDINEEKIAVIDAGHYGTEWPVMRIIAKTVENKINEMGFNNSVIISECARDPYKFK